jgi:hypothetical protein
LRILPALLLAFTVGPAAASFLPPERITTEAEGHARLARNPQSALLPVPGGGFHLVYWTGGESTTPSTPSFVLHRQWSEAGGWTEPTIIDNSEFEGEHFGGRHPSAAITADGTLLVAWHDHRHCDPAPPNNSINNIEIYLDRKQSTGAFSADDERLTTSATGTVSDSGYLPRLAVSNGGVIAVVWYDFHYFNEQADIFAKFSDATGIFTPGEPMSALRATDAQGSLAYVVPNAAFTPDGSLHAVWTSGFGGASPLRYATIPQPLAQVTPADLASRTGAFFDPPKIRTTADGTVLVTYTHEPASVSDIRLLRKAPGSASFDAPVTLVGTASAESSADFLPAGDGSLHLVWIDDVEGRHVRYALVNPATGAKTREARLTTEPGDWERPTLAVDSLGAVYVVFEEDRITEGSLYFVRPAAGNADGWLLR